MDKGLTKQQIIDLMTLSPHGDLSVYLEMGGQAACKNPEFAAHFTSYLAAKSQVRDINIAMPLICLAEPRFREQEFVDNALAHIAQFSPREMVQAYHFAAKGEIRNKDVVTRTVMEPATQKSRTMKMKVGGWKAASAKLSSGGYLLMGSTGILQKAGRVTMLDGLITRYLRSREANRHWFDRNVVQFRRDMKRLYFFSRTKPSEYAKAVLYDGVRPCGSALEAIHDLPRMNSKEAAAAILEFKLPFLTISSVLGSKAKDPAILMAMIDRMSPSELQTNMKMLEKFGMKDFPETRAAFEAAQVRMVTQSGSNKTTLKTTKAAAAVSDPGLRQKLQATQEKQLNTVKGINGDWLVLGDSSPSMSTAIEAAKEVAAILARMVRGKVHLIFFNSTPRYFDVTGKTYDEILALTRHVMIEGGTSIGCGLDYILDRKWSVDGIAVISDAQENTSPRFHDRYQRYVSVMGNEPTVYLYRFQGSMPARLDVDLAVSMNSIGVELNEFDLRRGFDSYSLPNIVAGMKVGKYGLIDEIMESKLITVESVLKDNKTGELVSC